MNGCPCFCCDKRKPACHDFCLRYKMWVRKEKSKKVANKNDSIVHDYIVSGNAMAIHRKYKSPGCGYGY